MAAMNGQELLIIRPTELQFPCLPSISDLGRSHTSPKRWLFGYLKKWSEVFGKQISCCLQLFNKTNQYVAFKVLTTNATNYAVRPATGVILPDSICDLTVTMYALKEAPPGGLQCKDKFLIRTFVAEYGATAADITSEMFNKEHGKVIEEFKLCVVYVPADSPSPVPDVAEEISITTSSIFENEIDHGSSLTNDLHQLSIDKDDHETYRSNDGTISGIKGTESGITNRTSSGMSSISLFSNYDIEDATNSLSDSSKIGQGGYGGVYRGYLDNTEVAIKMLDANGHQGIAEFLQELEVLGRMRHPNLVNLVGACIKLRALVYEFLPNGSLENCLQKNATLLTWQRRTRIIYQICLGLIFLHSNKPQPLVHGDLKPANILLDVNFNCKLADFGLCRFIPEGSTTVAYLDTVPKGTFGYIDPEFMKTGILTPGCDVYSFGVTILRLLTGMEAIGIAMKVRPAYKDKTLMTLVDRTAGNWPDDVSEFLAYFGLSCCARRRSSGLMKEIERDLGDILADIRD